VDASLPLEVARSILAQQPFSVFLGAEVTRFDAEGKAELRLAIKPEYLQQYGFVHGGVLSYLADNALTFAAGAAFGPAVITSEYKINYLRPATGDTLIARAEVLHAGKRQAVCRCDVFAVKDGAEKLCATAQGTILRND
jgi:uncharacterized protein (TIGR00369 family)